MEIELESVAIGGSLWQQGRLPAGNTIGSFMDLEKDDNDKLVFLSTLMMTAAPVDVRGAGGGWTVVLRSWLGCFVCIWTLIVFVPIPVRSRSRFRSGFERELVGVVVVVVVAVDVAAFILMT